MPCASMCGVPSPVYLYPLKSPLSLPVSASNAQNVIFMLPYEQLPHCIAIVCIHSHYWALEAIVTHILSIFDRQ